MGGYPYGDVLRGHSLKNFRREHHTNNHKLVALVMSQGPPRMLAGNFIAGPNRDTIHEHIANAAGEDVAYFGSDGEGSLKRFFDPLF